MFFLITAVYVAIAIGHAYQTNKLIDRYTSTDDGRRVTSRSWRLANCSFALWVLTVISLGMMIISEWFFTLFFIFILVQAILSLWESLWFAQKGKEWWVMIPLPVAQIFANFFFFNQLIKVLEIFYS